MLLQYIYNCITLDTSIHGYYYMHVLYVAPSQYIDLIPMTLSTPNDLINFSISSHQINEINYQCLKYIFILVLRRSVTLHNSNILASNVPLVYKSMYYCQYPLLMLSLTVVYSGFNIINY